MSLEPINAAKSPCRLALKGTDLMRVNHNFQPPETAKQICDHGELHLLGTRVKLADEKQHPEIVLSSSIPILFCKFKDIL